MDLKLDEFENAFAKGEEAVLVGNGNGATLPLLSNVMEQGSDQTEQDVNGAHPGCESRSDNGWSGFHVSGFTCCSQSILNVPQTNRTRNVRIEPLAALRLAGEADAVRDGELMEWGDLTLELLTVCAPAQHGS